MKDGCNAKFLYQNQFSLPRDWPRDRHVGTCPCLLSFLATYKLCSNFQVTTEKDSRFGRAVQTIACHLDAQSKRSRAIWTSGPNDRVPFFFCTLPRLGAAFAKPCCLSPCPHNKQSSPAFHDSSWPSPRGWNILLSRYDWLIDTISYFDWLVFYEVGKASGTNQIAPPRMSAGSRLVEN